MNLIRVDGNGQYCVIDKALTGDACGYLVTVQNGAGIEVLSFPTGDTDEGSFVTQTLVEGENIIPQPGTYKFDLSALLALHGTEAPEDPSEHILVSCRPLSCEELSAMCACKRGDSGDTTFEGLSDTLTEILTQLQCQPQATGLAATSGPFCDQPVFLVKGECTVFNPETKTYESIDMANVGQNPTTNSCETRPFVCEFPADGADVTVTAADVIATLAGATFPSGAAADDAASVYLHDVTMTLAHLGDEADGDFVSTTCDAMVTDDDTSKVTNLEPGGDYPLTQEPGNDVPAFTLVVAEGSNVKVCGTVSVKLDKSGEVVPKPEAAEEAGGPVRG